MNTVRVERNRTSFGGLNWRVVAGHPDNPTLIGYVQSARTVHGERNSHRWTATTPGLLTITDRARNRTHAVAELVRAHQRAAGVE